MAERIYLRTADKLLAAALHGLQHGINSQTERTVVLEIFLLPSNGSFATHGKERDIPVGGIHIVLHLVDVFHFGFYPDHPVPLMQQSGGHTTDDRHQKEISDKYLML